MRTLQDRVAVVTGGGSGIGRATAELLARRGCHVALVDVNEAGLEETKRLLQLSGRRVSTHQADVTSWERMQALPAEVLGEHGACHIVVNNAGVTSAGAFLEESMEDLRWIVDINLWGVVHGCRAFLPTLLEADEAHLVNLSSMVALAGMPNNAAYSLTKGAVRSFTEALRSELITTQVGVTAVFPGAHRTAIMASARGAQGDLIARAATSRLAPLMLRPPSGVAKAIVRGIERNRARAVVGPDARALDVLARVAPGRTGFVGRALPLAERARTSGRERARDSRHAGSL